MSSKSVPHAENSKEAMDERIDKLLTQNGIQSSASTMSGSQTAAAFTGDKRQQQQAQVQLDNRPIVTGAASPSQASLRGGEESHDPLNAPSFGSGKAHPGRSASTAHPVSDEDSVPEPPVDNRNQQRQKQQLEQQAESSTRSGIRRTEVSRRTQLPTSSMEKVDQLYVCLMNAIDQLKLGCGIDLPEIVVIGDQSHGKSTVLEAIAQVKLPKGDNTCTKCLIRLCIRNERNEHAKIEYKGEIEEVNNPNEDEFSQKLKQVMDKNFPDSTSMDEVINVRISGPKRPNLTVVDVPGFKGNDSKEKEEALEKRLKNENVIIVVVLTAITDFEASKGYAMAVKLDKNFKRTFFVLTHCDNLQENKQKKVEDELQRGNAFAVSCYSAKGAYASEDEERFFAEERFWSSFSPSKLGIGSLTAHLAYSMQLRILPRRNEIYKRVKERFSELDAQLRVLEREKEDFKKQVATLIRETNIDIAAAVVGRHVTKKNSLYSKCKHLWEDFGKNMEKIADDLRKKLSHLIDEEMIEQGGWELKLLENVFPVLVRIIDQHLMGPIDPIVRNLISGCELIVESEITKIVQEHMKNHQLLGNSVIAKIKQYLIKLRSDVDDRIKTVIEMEQIVFQSGQPKKNNEIEEEQETAKSSENGKGSGMVESIAKVGARYVTKVLPPGIDQLAETAIEGAIGEAIKYVKEATSDETDTNARALLLKKCKSYINFVELRIANSIPKAIAKFMLHRLAEDIWTHVNDNLDEETETGLRTGNEEESKRKQAEREHLRTVITDLSFL